MLAAVAFLAQAEKPCFVCPTGEEKKYSQSCDHFSFVLMPSFFIPIHIKNLSIYYNYLQQDQFRSLDLLLYNTLFWDAKHLSKVLFHNSLPLRGLTIRVRFLDDYVMIIFWPEGLAAIRASEAPRSNDVNI